MKTRAIHAVLCLALFFALSCPAAAVDVGVSFVIDGVEIEKEIATQTVNQTVYVSYWPIVEALYPDAQTQWANGQAEVRAEGLELFINCSHQAPVHLSGCQWPLPLCTRRRGL